MSAYKVRIDVDAGGVEVEVELTDERAAFLYDLASIINAARGDDAGCEIRMYVERRYTGVRASGGGA